MNTLNSQFLNSRTACHLQIGIDYARITIASRAAANVSSSVQPDPFNQRSLSSIPLSTSQQYHAALLTTKYRDGNARGRQQFNQVGKDFQPNKKRKRFSSLLLRRKKLADFVLDFV
ncbi:Hypothetical_protein [Hexamita inflata]|uniref:Hypothetical_protein n=1 Tax=Hexamita inflata TaxID=28002 RepID=A0AA86P4W0_9EUKA|nr:Hypothetical protein HINF_LOCUS19930 [Hexamita inflata]CAI9932286.1 Hypothetical protein HINF_LOCUS19931 [Hexamita inflata]CAI9932287.1 Hypothetical protein HINF_LOCUS19932 [Hexamita inflata]